MLKQVFMRQYCGLFSALKCQVTATAAAAATIHHHHHYHYHTTTTTTTTTTTDNDPTTTTTTTTDKTYDPTTYHLPFDLEEERSIVDTLNSATLKNLMTFGVGKRSATKVIKYRDTLGEFSKVSQLLEIDGLGIRATEEVCRCVLGSVFAGLDDTADLEPEVIIDPRRLIKPRLKEEVLRGIEWFVALQVTAGFLSWVLCSTDGRIHSLATHTLLTPNTRFDPLRIYDKVVSVRREIPEADFYVWEDRTGQGHLAKAPLGTVIVALQLAQIKGMLTVLLGRGVEEEEEEEVRYEKQSRLLFLKDNVVPRLFRLKVGSDRLSCLGLVDRLMDGERVVEWLSPVALESPVHWDYFSRVSGERRYVAGAVLVAVAFQEVLIARNSAALRVLSQ